MIDIDVNADNGSITNLLTTAGRISGTRLIGCGSYAVVVRMD